MNELDISLVWLVGQVTLLCAASGVIYLIARRRHPGAGATAALSGVLLTVVLTLGVFSPWPRWSLDRLRTATSNAPATPLPRESSDAAMPAPRSDEPVTAESVSEVAPPRAVDVESTSAAAWSAFWRSLGREMAAPPPRPVESGFRWPAWLAVSLVLAMAVGALRLLAGWLTVRRYLRRSTLINDRSLHELLDILRAELGCRRDVALRESRDVASAATVGWRRPVVLLPRGWRDWSDAERRAVLAHELAHVTAGDAASWLAAQVGLLLHFYHPLVHWLAHRLRLEQELAADALAARLTGSSQTYLTTLAELAVRQPDRPIAWPARAFLPTRGTLLRRIEMLRDTKTPALRSSTLRRGTVITLTVAAAVFAAGLRPPQGREALAQQDRPTAEDRAKPQAAEGRGFNLANVPGSAKVVVGLRPAELANRPEMQPLVNVIDEVIEADKTGIRLANIDQFLLIIAGPVSVEAGEQFFRGPVIEIRMKEPTDFTALAKAQDLMTIDTIIDISRKDQAPLTVEQRAALRTNELLVQQFRMSLSQHDAGGGMYEVDDRTVLYGLGTDLGLLLDDLDRISVGRPPWIIGFESVAKDEICVVWDVAAVGPLFNQEFQNRPDPIQGMFVPLWQNTDLVIGGARFGDRLSVTAEGWASDAEAAAKVEKTLTSLVPFARGLLESTKVMVQDAPAGIKAMLENAIGLAESALDNAKIETQNNRVTVTVEGDAGSVAMLAAAMLPAVQEAREDARRRQTRNNLKQIGLAFHNYHDVYGQFPPPVLYGKAGNGKSKHPHSWRVAILPFVDAAHLYEQYRFDEPWDSENNLKVGAQIPAVFRSPNDDSGSINAAYFVLVGENTAVGEKPKPDGNPTKGIGLRDITDGTSNTLLVVEAKRDIPWTKPEDIAYSPDKDFPEVGGWHGGAFHVLFADGSVNFLSHEYDEKLLRSYVTRNGGEDMNGR